MSNCWPCFPRCYLLTLLFNPKSLNIIYDCSLFDRSQLILLLMLVRGNCNIVPPSLLLLSIPLQIAFSPGVFFLAKKLQKYLSISSSSLGVHLCLAVYFLTLLLSAGRSSTVKRRTKPFNLVKIKV